MTDNIQKKFHICNIVLFVCAICCLIYYDYTGGLWLKGVTSSWFVILGLVNLVYARKKGLKISVIYLMETGLFLGMCADVLLGIEFMVGLVCFALGHVFYLVAFFRLEKPRKKDLMFIVPIAIVSMFAVTGTPFIRVEDSMMQMMLLGYALIIACMLGKALSNLSVNRATSRKVIALGSTLFLFSDLMLAIDMFGTASRLTWVLCSYTYWPAQCLLAYSMFHLVNEGLQGKR